MNSPLAGRREQGSRILIVTGGGRGIGAATAKLAASRGFRVCVNYLRNKESASQIVTDIESRGGVAVALRADVSIESEVVAGRLAICWDSVHRTRLRFRESPNSKITGRPLPSRLCRLVGATIHVSIPIERTSDMTARGRRFAACQHAPVARAAVSSTSRRLTQLAGGRQYRVGGRRALPVR